jgi:hypothetical protein
MGSALRRKVVEGRWCVVREDLLSPNLRVRCQEHINFFLLPLLLPVLTQALYSSPLNTKPPQLLHTSLSSQQFHLSSHKMSGLDIFVLIVYIALFNPVLYCLWKHGKPGILAWLPLQSFCILRIVGSILDLHNAAVHSTNEDALIFNNVGLSPLLLAAAGVLHEA